MYALPTAWAIKMALSVVISFIALTFLPMMAGLYYMSNFHLAMQKSIWSEGTASRFYLTEADGHAAPTWVRLMQEIYFPWLARLGLPYFQMPCCCNIGPSDGRSAFLDSAEDGAQNKPPEQLLPNNPPLSNTSYTSTSSEAGSADHAMEEGTVATLEAAGSSGMHQGPGDTMRQQETVAKTWMPTDVSDGRQAVKNANYLQVDISTLPEADGIQHATPTEEEVILQGCSDESGHGALWLHSDVNVNEVATLGLKRRRPRRKMILLPQKPPKNTSISYPKSVEAVTH